MAEMPGSIWLLATTKRANSAIPPIRKYDKIGIRIVVSCKGIYNANAANG